ncbi:hypothetical protein HPB47_014526 [Ixodes persulcatus]|uniref:Uncharacterized protein n=1 Tax=Ixodes persulcatus TaxID=34615 RepID=A0AC60R3K9_IXOPE|nr:hypothetical protein HPB47_014526 [Ixodes persulcatus]
MKVRRCPRLLAFFPPREYPGRFLQQESECRDKVNSKSAAGLDKITNKAMRNLSDEAIESLTGYYNESWKSGRLPQQWKTAKMILLPKPGKPPGIENLRPISLTSCVGKVLEHVVNNRWQRYLEDGGHYPDTMFGFREKLSTQDAMALIKSESLDTTKGRALLGLDLQSAFDKVNHSAILERINELGFGPRSYAYIKDFLTGRKAILHAGELEIEERELGSVGTPQGSGISPLLFNLVMIKVADRLGELRARHTMYADDITLWSTSDREYTAQEELQEAIQVIEDALEGTGLKCSPSKSKLLAINPRSPRWDNIKLVTKDGPISRVDWIKILGMTIERTRRNGITVAKRESKTNAAVQLIKRVARRKGGMREHNVARIVQSFSISHVTYVASYLKWQSIEKRKHNALIRKVYKNAPGLLHNTNTEKLEALGMHNTVEEIIEAQKTSQQQRLEQTRSGRTLLERLKIPTRGEEAKEEAIRPEDMQRLNVRPIPRHMHPRYDEGRRKARAQALYRLYERDAGAVYVDAARQGDRCVAVVARAADGKLLTSAGVKTGSVRTAEEVAIALAASLPTTTTVLSDSMQALRNFAKGRVRGIGGRVV